MYRFWYVENIPEKLQNYCFKGFKQNLKSLGQDLDILLKSGGQDIFVLI